MNLDEILEKWKKDSVIDQTNLDQASINNATLHSTYLELYANVKLRLKRKQIDLTKLIQEKWLYFSGKMTKEEMDAKCWPYDPFNGLSKPLKSDLEKYIETDPDVVKLNLIIEYQNVMLETLKEILDTIRWRHQTIRNILEHRKFIAGV